MYSSLRIRPPQLWPGYNIIIYLNYRYFPYTLPLEVTMQLICELVELHNCRPVIHNSCDPMIGEYDKGSRSIAIDIGMVT